MEIDTICNELSRENMKTHDDHDMGKPIHRHERAENKNQKRSAPMEKMLKKLNSTVAEEIWSNVSSPPQCGQLRLRSGYLSQHVVVVEIIVFVVHLVKALIRIQKRRCFGRRLDLDNLSK